MNTEPPYPLLTEKLIKGKLIPFLGAGASLREETDEGVHQPSTESLPTAKELAGLLAGKLDLDANEIGASTLLEVASYYALVENRIKLQKQLRDIFLHAYRPSSIHRFLANLSTPLLIMTSNYDRLLEEAFLANNKPFHLVVIPAARDDYANNVLWWKPGNKKPEIIRPTYLDIPNDNNSIILKLHGSVDPYSEEFDSFVITEDDYLEMAKRLFKNSFIPSCLYPKLEHSSFVFLGYSLRDIHVRKMLQGSRFGLNHYAIVKNMSRLEFNTWKALKIDAYEILIEEFVEAMSKSLETHPRRSDKRRSG